MKWQKDQYSNTYELIDDKGRLRATIEAVPVEGVWGFGIWNGTGQHIGLAPTLEAAKLKAYELLSTN